MSLRLALGLGTLALSACAAGPPPANPRPTVEPTQLSATTADGVTVRGAGLIGAIVMMGAERARIDAVELAGTPHGDVTLYQVSVVDGRDHARSLCTADADGRRLALVVPGDDGRMRFTCTSGAVGKCILWGYPPWPIGRPAPMRALHAACVRMVRADYGGDGATATRDGTRIGFCDPTGIHRCDDARHELEAGWSSAGAVCVARPRIAALATLGALAIRYPHLRGHLGLTACSPTRAASDPTTRILSFRIHPPTETP